MANRHCEAALAASTVADLRRAVLEFAASLGFRTVSAVTVTPSGDGGFHYMSIDNNPSAYEEAYYNQNDARRDPVLQHLRRRSVPILWNQQTYVEAGCAELWEAQALFGYRFGIATASHLPHATHFVLGLDTDIPIRTADANRLIAEMQLFAVYAQEAIIALAHANSTSIRPCLTHREHEALLWTMEGKTAWETAHILGISERTATEHMKNAMHKLNCNSKHQAVVKAIKLGILG